MTEEQTLGTILIVDDDQNITDLLSYNLTSEGYAVEVVRKATTVTNDMVKQVRLIIADAMEQPMTGLDLCNIIKSDPETEHIPIIICTQNDSEDFIIDAFDAGIDDFISKPFSLREIVARIKAILRRHPAKAASATTTAQHYTLTIPGSKLEIDLETQRVTEDGIAVPLTKTEYAILVFLIKNSNKFYNRLQIFQEIWKDEDLSNARVVDTNISRLRKKLGESSKFLINRYGMGYAIVDKLNL